MNIESIIGITSGIIAIVAAIKPTYKFIKRITGPTPTTELFNQLMQKDISDSERRKILEKLNSSKLINNRISKDYIQHFTLEKRGKEAVLFDLCDYNNIEPTDDICIGLIGTHMPSLKQKYLEKRQKQQSLSSSTPQQELKMEEQPKPTSLQKEQRVYLSELLKERFPDSCDRLIQILEKHNVKYSFLKGTKDIWCRDYMPVQTESGKLIQFKYEPSYLKGKKEWEESRTDGKEVCALNGIEAQQSDINLDGGNVLICNGRAIISDRIFSENPDRDKDELTKELSRLLECEIIIIPSQKSDMTGHADGMIRFVNKNTILGNKLADEFKNWQTPMQKVIKKYDLQYIDMPFFTEKDSKHPLSAIGIYVNYLEVNNLIVLPIFNRDEDNQAIDILKTAFPDKVIETINYDEVAKEGGLLNCTTWVIR